MAKNKGGYAVEGGRIEEPDLVDRPTRAEKVAVAGRADAIVQRLLACGRADLKLLPIDDDLRGALKVFPGLSKSSRSRQLRMINRMVRDSDVEAIEAALEGGNPSDQRSAELERWRRRIIDTGDEAIDAFADAYGEVDRQRIRQLARQARKAGDTGKAFRQLYQALAESLSS